MYSSKIYSRIKKTFCILLVIALTLGASPLHLLAQIEPPILDPDHTLPQVIRNLIINTWGREGLLRNYDIDGVDLPPELFGRVGNPEWEAWFHAEHIASPIQPDSLTIWVHNSCYNTPILDATMEIFINNERTVHDTSDGIFSFEEIPAGSTVSFNISVPCETIYQYPAWEIFAGSVDIPRFEPAPEFIMPDAPVVLMAQFETWAIYDFDPYTRPEWCDDVANTPLELALGEGGDFAPAMADVLFMSEDTDLETVTIGDDGVTENIHYAPLVLSRPTTYSAIQMASGQTWTPSGLAVGIIVPVGDGFPWTATSNAAWLTINNIVHNPPHTNDSFTLSVTANTGGAPRTGIVNIEFSDGFIYTITVIQGHEPALLLSVGAWEVTANGGMSLVDVNANGQWTITTNAPWLEVFGYYPQNRTGVGAFIMEALPHFGNTPRHGTITVTAPGAPTRTISVVQNPGPVMRLPIGTLEMPPAPVRSEVIDVVSNTTWTVTSSNPAWLTASVTSHTGNGSFRIYGAGNPGATQRTGTITVSAPGVGSRIIDVVQEPGNGLVLLTDRARSPVNAATGVITVYSDRTWNVPTSNQSWLTVSEITPASRTGNGSFRVNTTENMGTASRTGTITVTAPGAPARSVTVTQEGRTEVLGAEWNIWNPSFAENETIIPVTASTNWNVDIRSDAQHLNWLRVESIFATGQVRITADENPGSSARSGTITLSARGAPTVVVRVMQDARGTISMTRSRWQTMAAPNAISVPITAIGSWEAESDSPWLRVCTAIGNGRRVVTISTMANREGVYRSGTITVTAGDGSRATLSVTQSNIYRLRYTFWWNEHPNEWFLLERAVQNAGGTFNHGTMQATVYGVTVPFHLNSDGVERVDSRGIKVRADVFYHAVVNAAGGGITFLAGHAAFNNPREIQHVYVKMFVSQNSPWWNQSYFRDNIGAGGITRTRFGLQYATLGGGTVLPIWDLENLRTLRSWGNRPSDIDLNNVDFVLHINSGVWGITELMDAHAFSLTQEPFFYHVSGHPSRGYNSGSIISGLLHATGLHPGNLPLSAPGWDNPTRRSFFGR